MPLDLVTYKELEEKYPIAKDDIERLRISKNNALIGYAIFVLLIGFIAGWTLCAFNGKIVYLL